MSFAAKIARIAEQNKCDVLLARNIRYNREWEYINYVSSRDFDHRVITTREIEEAKCDAEYEALIKDRIVLFGDIYNSEDMQTTPYNKLVPGIFIHAHSLDTILQGAYYQEISKWQMYAISILICLIFTSLSLALKAYMKDISGLIIRVAQAILMFAIYWVGCKL